MRRRRPETNMRHALPNRWAFACFGFADRACTEIPAAHQRSGGCCLVDPGGKAREAGRRKAACMWNGDGLFASPGFRAPTPGLPSGRPDFKTASRCDDPLSAARPAHPRRNRSGCVIPERSVDGGEPRACPGRFHGVSSRMQGPDGRSVSAADTRRYRQGARRTRWALHARPQVAQFRSPAVSQPLAVA